MGCMVCIFPALIRVILKLLLQISRIETNFTNFFVHSSIPTEFPILYYKQPMANIIYKEESYKIIGACTKVHGSLGSGFLEAVYQEALEDEFLRQGIPFERQVKLNILI